MSYSFQEFTEVSKYVRILQNSLGHIHQCNAVVFSEFFLKFTSKFRAIYPSVKN